MSVSRKVRQRAWGTIGTSLVIALALSACSDSASAPEPSESQVATDGATDGGAAAESPTADVEAARARIAQLTAANTFEAPSEPFEVGAALEGKLVSVIVSGASAAFVQAFIEGVQDSTELLGARVDVQDSEYDPIKAAELIDKAVAAGASAIVMQGVDANSVAASVRAAADAGIAVIEATSRDAGAVSEELKEIGVAAISSFCYTCAGEQLADAAVDITDGNVNAMIYNVPGLSVTDAMLAGFESRLAEVAPDAKVTVVDAPVADWEANLATLTTSNLQINPDINVLVPVFDSMVGLIEPALASAGLTDKAIATYNASESALQMLKDENIVKANIGGSPYWLGWASLDQVARIASGNEPVADGLLPHRQFDASNIQDVDLSAPQQAWYGDFDLAGAYATLWGRG